MAELTVMKTATGALIPADQESVELIQKMKVGQGVKVRYSQIRNLPFHRKGMRLVRLAFDAWDAPELEYKGQPVEKDFTRFRKDLTILAGHYESFVNLKGEVRLEAKSWNFGNMKEDEFQAVYKSLLNLVWRLVLKDAGYLNIEAVDNVVEQLLGYE